MRKDRVLIPVLHMANETKCFFRLVSTHIFIENYQTNLFYHKNANVWVV